MSFPRYPKYKPSGVEWLGEVPTVAGTFQVPSASLVSSSDVDPVTGDGTWNVPATLEARP